MDYHGGFDSLDKIWLGQCRVFLPVISADSMWKFSREELPDDPEQGWKLHLSATILTATEALARVGPFLKGRGALFKAPASIQELDKINSGIHYGYSQVGKFITVYPRSPEEAVQLAQELDRLTEGMRAPSIPFDLKFRPGSCVHYRYGSFTNREIERADGSRTKVIRNAAGAFIPDRRDAAAEAPDWSPDPFGPREMEQSVQAGDSLLRTRFRVFQAISQRGKGGVYNALDISETPPRLCVLKEGRRHGETGLDGRDGFHRVSHENQVLNALKAHGVGAPRVLASFEAGENFYLAIERIEGENLEDWLRRKPRRIPVAQALELGGRIARALAKIHSAGWVWRDCKPANLMLAGDGELRPVDFEGACRVDSPDPLPWGTASFVPAEWHLAFDGRSRLPEDLFALGATIYLLLAGRTPDFYKQRTPVERLRKGVPEIACRLMEDLLSEDPARRPSASAVAQLLSS